MQKEYCYWCDKLVEYKIENKIVTFNIKGLEIFFLKQQYHIV